MIHIRRIDTNIGWYVIVFLLRALIAYGVLSVVVLVIEREKIKITVNTLSLRGE